VNEPLRLECLEQIARTGDCYKNEARAMAKEIIELRKKPAPAPVPTPPDYYSIYPPYP